MHSIARHIICLWIPWRCLGVHLLTHGQFDFQACSMLMDPMAMPRGHLYGQSDFKQKCEKSKNYYINVLICCVVGTLGGMNLRGET